MKARISHIKDTLVIEFPKKESFGNMNCILRNKYPYFLELMNIGWVDSKKYNHEEMIRKYYGKFDEERESKDFIPLIQLSTLLDKPEIGRSFYGLVSFTDIDTPTYYLRKRKISEYSMVETINRNLKIIGECIVVRKGYYHSFPVVKIDELDISNRLEQICEDTNIHPQDKFKKIKHLLN